MQPCKKRLSSNIKSRIQVYLENTLKCPLITNYFAQYVYERKCIISEEDPSPNYVLYVMHISSY